MTVTLTLLLAAAGPGAEISTNGTGGGAWSDAATWRGGKPPGQDDDAVVTKGDTAVFDRDDTGKVTCRKLYLDPQSALVFKTQAGRVVARFADEVESYGTIRLDGTKSPDDRHEFHFVSAEAAGRKLKLAKGGGLVLSGRAGRPGEECNVVFAADPVKGLGPSEPGATVETTAGVRIDAQRAAFQNVHLTAAGIDNTGAKPNERLNVVGCAFTLSGRLSLSGCDTPLVAGNTFEARKEGVGYPAIGLSYTTLVDVRKNVIRGYYNTGIMGGYAQTDGSVQENTIEGCVTGIYWAGAVGMLKGNVVRNCISTGIVLTSAEGVIEDTLIENCPNAINVAGAKVTFTNGKVVPAAKDSKPVLFVGGELKLLNTNLKPEDVTFHKPFTKAKPPERLVTAMDYVVVGVKGSVPEGTQAELRTAGAAAPAAGAADPNVRNNPALVSAGRTPVPQALNPLIVRSWAFDHAGQPVPAPDYTLKLLAPAEAADKPRKVLKELPVKPLPAWFRERPNGPEPTVEVTLP